MLWTANGCLLKKKLSDGGGFQILHSLSYLFFFSFFGGVASCSVLFGPFSGKKVPFPSDLNFLVKLLN